MRHGVREMMSAPSAPSASILANRERKREGERNKFVRERDRQRERQRERERERERDDVSTACFQR